MIVLNTTNNRLDETIMSSLNSQNAMNLAKRSLTAAKTKQFVKNMMLMIASSPLKNKVYSNEKNNEFPVPDFWNSF
jgi:hypothetical protein